MVATCGTAGAPAGPGSLSIGAIAAVPTAGTLGPGPAGVWADAAEAWADAAGACPVAAGGEPLPGSRRGGVSAPKLQGSINSPGGGESSESTMAIRKHYHGDLSLKPTD